MPRDRVGRDGRWRPTTQCPGIRGDRRIRDYDTWLHPGHGGVAMAPRRLLQAGRSAFRQEQRGLGSRQWPGDTAKSRHAGRNDLPADGPAARSDSFYDSSSSDRSGKWRGYDARGRTEYARHSECRRRRGSDRGRPAVRRTAIRQHTAVRRYPAIWRYPTVRQHAADTDA